MAGYTQALRARSEESLVTLLRLRPDLAAPPPATLRSLAARATTRVSLERVLAGVDALVLQTLEAVRALEGAVRPDPDDVGRAWVGDGEVATALGLTPEEVAGALTHALDLGLLWLDDGTDLPDGADLPDRADLSDGAAPPTGTTAPAGVLPLRTAPGLEEVLGPHPAGLGPGLRVTLARRSEQGLARVAGGLGTEPAADAVDLEAIAARLARPATVESLLAQAPPGARQVLDALTWGPPVGRSPESRSSAPRDTDRSPARTAVEWLLRHGLLAVQDPQHVVLPREVGLALRGGRTHREAATAPHPAPSPVDRRTADADSALHAEELVRLVGALVTLWGEEPAPVLRSGGLGSRELRRAATRLEVTDGVAALVVELAGAAGLVVDDGDDQASFAPTSDGEEWLTLDVGERWQTLAEAWLTAERAAWLVGSRDERGSLRSALDPESRRPWAPRLRRSVLEVLADAAQAPDAASLSPTQVHQVLSWRAPRSAPPEHAVEAVTTEAALLGVLGAGALSTAGRSLLEHSRGSTGPDAPATALTAQLPPAVDEVLLQGDLTGIVPGRPSPALAGLLEAVAEVESRGAGLTVRFTTTSVRRALDAGRTAEQVLADLSAHARGGVPQPLEYLVLDVARRHGLMRVGMASSYLRSDDPHLLAGLVEDRTLRHLGLLTLAPTVIAAQASPAALVAALRERGLAPVTEDPAGRVLVTGPERHVVRRARGRRPARPSPVPATDLPTADDARDRRLTRLARDLLRARAGTAGADPDRPLDGGGAVEPRRATVTTGGAGTPDPVLALAILREAAAEGQEVWLEIADPRGGVQRRRVRPVRVDAGRVRAVDPEREAELTVAVHRIASVTPTSGD